MSPAQDPGRSQGEAEKAINDSLQLDMTKVKRYTVQSWIQLRYEAYTELRPREEKKDYYNPSFPI